MRGRPLFRMQSDPLSARVPIFLIWGICRRLAPVCDDEKGIVECHNRLAVNGCVGQSPLVHSDWQSAQPIRDGRPRDIAASRTTSSVVFSAGTIEANAYPTVHVLFLSAVGPSPVKNLPGSLREKFSQPTDMEDVQYRLEPVKAASVASDYIDKTFRSSCIGTSLADELFIPTSTIVQLLRKSVHLQGQHAHTTSVVGVARQVTCQETKTC